MHDHPIPGLTRISANAGEPARALILRRSSPQFEAGAWSNDPTDPEEAPPPWSPLTGAVSTIANYLSELASAGRKNIDAITDAAREAATATSAAFEESVEAGAILPGEEFTQAGMRLGAAVSETARDAQKMYSSPRSCGTVTTADGRVINVPCASDDVLQAERARSDLLKTAATRPNYDAAYNRARATLEAKKETARADEWQQTFRLKERQAAQDEDLFHIKKKILEHQERRTAPTQAELQYWWQRPSPPSQEPQYRRVKAIGSGVPGGILERLF